MKCQAESAVVSTDTPHSSPRVPFYQKAERTRPRCLTHLYDILVSQITSPVIPRLLMRTQMQGREGRSRATKIQSWLLFQASRNDSLEHLGNLNRHQHGEPLYHNPFDLLSEAEKLWVTLSLFPSSAQLRFSLEHKFPKGRVQLHGPTHSAW